MEYKPWQKNRAGIYVIVHNSSKRGYVGQTQNIASRWSVHLACLRSNKHHCSYLQRAWNKYGEDEFTFRVVQLCTVSDLDKFEIEWFDRFQGRLFNTHPPGKSHRGFVFPDEVIEKMRVSASIASNTPEQKAMRSARAKRQHAEGKIGRRELVNPVRVCIKCGIEFHRYKLFSGGHHNSKSCLICMAEAFANHGGQFNIDNFDVDRDTWDYAAYMLTCQRKYFYQKCLRCGAETPSKLASYCDLCRKVKRSERARAIGKRQKGKRYNGNHWTQLDKVRAEESAARARLGIGH